MANGFHKCPAPGCETQVPDKMFACRTHWYAISKPKRDNIWRTYRPGQEVDQQPSPHYRAAAHEAIKELHDEHGL